MSKDLSEFSMTELLAEIERRQKRKVVKMKPAQKEPLKFRCSTCGLEDGDYFADSYGNFGLIWHYKCTDRPNPERVGKMFVSQGRFSGNTL